MDCINKAGYENELMCMCSVSEVQGSTNGLFLQQLKEFEVCYMSLPPVYPRQLSVALPSVAILIQK
jgi:hypothetical protein